MSYIMKIDIALLWRVTTLGVVVRAVMSLGGRMLPYLLEQATLAPLGKLVPVFVGAYFVYHHTEQDSLPSIIGGTLAAGLATLFGLLLAFNFTFAAFRVGFATRLFDHLGLYSLIALTILGAMLGGLLGTLIMLLYRRYSHKLPF